MDGHGEHYPRCTSATAPFPELNRGRARFTTTCTDYIRYSYDDVGNRLTEARPSGSTSYAYNAADELTSTTLGATTTDYSHDKNGNMTASGSDSYTYDLANRTKTITQGATTTTYSYDGLGKRLQASTGTNNADKTNFLWDPTWSLPEMVLERDGSGSQLRRYLYGHGPLSMTAGGGRSYYHRDSLGSITNVTSSSGAEQWSYAYEPFGTTTPTQVDANAASNPLAFTGQYSDPTGLYHLRARQYLPSIGRFGAMDPITSPFGTSHGSSYAYVGDRPTSATDPSGLIADQVAQEIDFLDSLPDQVQILGIEGKIYTGTHPAEDCGPLSRYYFGSSQCNEPIDNLAWMGTYRNCLITHQTFPWVFAGVGSIVGGVASGPGMATGAVTGLELGTTLMLVSPFTCMIPAAIVS